MEEGRKHIDDLFREELQGYQEMPDATVWDSIEQRLPKDGTRRSFLWLWVLLMAALMSSLGYYASRELVFNDKRTSDERIGLITSGGSPEKEGISLDNQIGEEKNRGEKRNLLEENVHRNSQPEKTQNIAKHSASETKPGVHAKVSNDPSNQANDDKGSKTHEETSGNTLAINKTIPEKENSDRDHKAVGNSPRSKNEQVTTSESKYTNPTPQASNTEPENIKSQSNNNKNSSSVISARGQESKSTTPGTGNNKTILPSQTVELTNKKPAAAVEHITQNKHEENKAPITPVIENKVNPSTKSNSSTVTNQNIALNNEPKNNPGVPSINEAKKPLLQHSGQRSAKPPLINNPGENKLPNDKGALKPDSKRVDVSDDKTANKHDALGKNDGNNKPVLSNAEMEKARPIKADPEKANGKAGNGTVDETKPVKISVEPDAKKSNIDVSYQDAQGKPLIIETKEYGIKINSNEPDNKNEPGSQGNTGAGGGDQAAEKGKKRKENGLKLDGGIKAGYERGFSNPTSSNITGNVFLQWNISPKIALTLQPGIRYNSVGSVSLLPNQSFHEITGQSLDSAHIKDSVLSTIQRNYIYRNSYDSINVSFAINSQRYFEIELPLLLQYKVTDNFSLLGGFQLSFGKVLQIGSNTQRIQGLTRMDTISFPDTMDMAPAPNIPDLDGHFSYTTPSFSSFDGSKYRNPVTNPARFGLMLGFSYEVRRRLLIDVMMRKNVSNLNFIPNEQVRKIYDQPYFRITIGYKLFQSK